MGSYIQKRGDHFYYVEGYDKREHRDKILSEALNKKANIKKQYIHGTLKHICLTNDINCALFWKSKEAAVKRAKLANNIGLKTCVKYLTREQFIKTIKDDGVMPFQFIKRKNILLRREEVLYLKNQKEQSS